MKTFIQVIEFQLLEFNNYYSNYWIRRRIAFPAICYIPTMRSDATVCVICKLKLLAVEQAALLAQLEGRLAR